MIATYLEKTMERASKMIEDARPNYGSIRGFQGVWANGRTLEECRRELKEVLEKWLLLRVRKGLRIPAIKGAPIRLPRIAA
jgi:predicted RNase H-like HicB family nuclease